MSTLFLNLGYKLTKRPGRVSRVGSGGRYRIGGYHFTPRVSIIRQGPIGSGQTLYVAWKNQVTDELYIM